MRRVVIAIDPGRTNIVFAVDTNGKIYKMTRGMYYAGAGINTINRKTAKWQADIKEAEDTFRRHSPKTTDQRTWDAFLQDYISVYETLWHAKTAKKRARERFRVYGLKRKILDKFFQTMKTGDRYLGVQVTYIAYGAAKFHHTGKGERSVPTVSVRKRCANFFPRITFVNEYNTSKVCHCCDRRICPVKKAGKEIRGLRWCPTTREFRDRDIFCLYSSFGGGTDGPYSISAYCSSRPPPFLSLSPPISTLSPPPTSTPHPCGQLPQYLQGDPPHRRHLPFFSSLPQPVLHRPPGQQEPTRPNQSRGCLSGGVRTRLGLRPPPQSRLDLCHRRVCVARELRQDIRGNDVVGVHIRGEDPLEFREELVLIFTGTGAGPLDA